jgi:hypothetical protein
MDKCTNEQFWATGAITGLNAFLLSQNKTISPFFFSDTSGLKIPAFLL